MKLHSGDRPPTYEPLVGIVRFDMENEGQVIHCMVSESALRGRAAMAGDTELDIAALFEKYRSEVENIAVAQYSDGEQHSRVRANGPKSPGAGDPTPGLVDDARMCGGTTQQPNAGLWVRFPSLRVAPASPDARALSARGPLSNAQKDAPAREGAYAGVGR